MLIKPEHFKARPGVYHPRCLKQWVDDHGLSWQKFLVEGYDHEFLLGLAPDDSDLLDLLKYHKIGPFEE